MLQVRRTEPLRSRLPGAGDEVLCLRQARPHFPRLHRSQRRPPQHGRQDLLPVRRGRTHLARLRQQARSPRRDAARGRRSRRSGHAPPACCPSRAGFLSVVRLPHSGESVKFGFTFFGNTWLSVHIPSPWSIPTLNTGSGRYDIGFLPTAFSVLARITIGFMFTLVWATR
ncbi:hypothetical protein B0I37DRAFT_194654 [Chaetomium sp. MPI-CAGE-AT-0009]|nr:hypothetical protein B0I37DRAFT_194654 [Chaetomium sp. MPI-CAGE-AT-0009]